MPDPVRGLLHIVFIQNLFEMVLLVLSYFRKLLGLYVNDEWSVGNSTMIQGENP